MEEEQENAATVAYDVELSGTDDVHEVFESSSSGSASLDEDVDDPGTNRLPQIETR